MGKKLIKHGKSLALPIEPSILESLGIDENTQLDISTDGNSLLIVPLKEKKRRKKINKTLKRCNLQYGKALKRLAE